MWSTVGRLTLASLALLASACIPTDNCVIISEYGTVLYDPVYGEDDGAIYCPTGGVSVSQLGKVVTNG